MNVVEKIVTDYYRIPLDNLKTPNRHAKLCEARHFIWFFMRKMYNSHYTMMGEMYDRHHSTIMSGVSDIRNRQRERQIREKTRQIEDLIVRHQ